MTGSEQCSKTFAEKLQHLIDTVHPEGRSRYSYREIEAGIRTTLGEDHPGVMTAAYVHQLATGSKSNPRMAYVEAFARFFGVPASYFTDDMIAEQINTELDRLIKWRDSPEGKLSQRISAMPIEHRNTISALVDHLTDYDAQTRHSRRRRKNHSS